MNITKKGKILAFVILMSIMVFTLPVPAAPLSGTLSKISVETPEVTHFEPSVSGDYVVWRDFRGGSNQIFLYNIATGIEKQITSGTEDHTKPAVGGNIVVWEDERFIGIGNGTDVAMYFINNGTTVRIANLTGNQQSPSTDGSLIVWEDGRDLGTTGKDIYAYDLSKDTVFRVTNAPGNQELPRVSNNVIVWQDTSAGDGDIYMYDYAGARIPVLAVEDIAGGSDQLTPSISGSRLVWSDIQTDWTYFRIYLQDIITADFQAITPDDNDHITPDIDGSRVVWLEGTPSEVYLNDTALADSETQVTANGHTKDSLRISGDRIVWHESDGVSDEIYMFTIGTAETCPVADFTILPSQSGAVPFDVQFTDASAAGSVPIVHWNWDFGDGNTSTLEDPDNTFSTAGTYSVRLTIDNLLCRNATPVANKYNISAGAAPVSSFTTNTTSGMVPLAVQFTNTSVGATAWNWSFGDGAYSDLHSPSHTYTSGGTYTVVLNASNTYGGSLARTTINALTGANENADNTISGIAITTPFGSQLLTYDTTQLPGLVNTGSTLICTSPQLLGDGWQNITFISTDGIGFIPDGTLIKGNISEVTLQTKEINPVGFSASTGAQSSINYSVTLPSYPSGAALNTYVWEGVLASDLDQFRLTAHGGGWSHVLGTAYTTKIVKTSFPSAGVAKIHMSVNSTWVANNEGRSYTHIIRIGDDGYGEVLQTRFLYRDSVKNLDYFEADSPRGLSTFGLSQLAGSGNPFQMIYLGVAQRVSNAGSPTSDSDSTGNTDFSSNLGPGSKGSKGKATENVAAAPPAAGPVATALLSVNTQGVITQTTVVQSPDRIATVTLGQGIVALNSAGNPLASITISPAAPPTSMHAMPPGNAISFAGIGYEMQPDGATFSPAISLTFSVNEIPPGQQYSVKAFEEATQRWVDLPTSYNPNTDTITAQVSHFCCIALFSEPVLPPSTPAPVHTAASLATPSQAPPSTAFNIFIDMLVWLTDIITKNMILLAGAAIVVVLVFFRGRKRRMDRIRYGR